MTKKRPLRPGPRGHAERERNFAINLMEYLVVPTFVLDAQCRVLIWNRACERLTGIKASEVIGTAEHWRAFYDEPRPCLADLIAQGRMEEIEALYAEHDEPRATGAATLGRHAENWCMMPRVGTRLYLAIDAGPIFDEGGHLLAVVETLRDITLHREAQLALERLAAHDGLTGIANRRSFDETLHQEWCRATRDGAPLSLLLADVDFFKSYNDAFGHQQGDECLKAIAKAIESEAKRGSDLVARYGGEEFAVILPMTKLRQAAIVAERIRATIRGLSLPHPRSEAGEWISVSIGAACAVPTAGGTPDSLVSAADQALYEAKRAGRDRVVHPAEAPEDDPEPAPSARERKIG